MFNKLPNRMFLRLETIDRYFQSCEIGDSRIVILENTIKNDDGTVKLKFYSKQGPVEIVFFRYYLEQRYYELDYTTYAGVKLFSLKTNRDNLEVKPCMGYSYNVDAKDIDLALLEFENYLQDNYGNIEDKWEQYQLEEKLAWESHKEQLKELL